MCHSERHRKIPKYLFFWRWELLFYESKLSKATLKDSITWTPGSSSSSGWGDGGGVFSKSEFSEPSFPLFTFFFAALVSDSDFLLLKQRYLLISTYTDVSKCKQNVLNKIANLQNVCFQWLHYFQLPSSFKNLNITIKSIMLGPSL